MPSIGAQIFWLIILAMPVACVARTVVFEEVFREAHDWCVHRSASGDKWWQRKFFFLFTCEYCFSHYVALAFMFLTGFHLLLPDWRGYLIAWLSLIFVANSYLNLYSRLRVEIHREKAIIKDIEQGQSAESDDARVKRIS